jgi:hypothetical protein
VLKWGLLCSLESKIFLRNSEKNRSNTNKQGKGQTPLSQEYYCSKIIIL